MASRLPTAEEQLLLEEINRFRANPAAEAELLVGAGASDDVVSAINYFGVSTSAFRSQLATLTAAAPLAWNGNLADAASLHSQAMIAADEQSHQLAGELSLSQRAQAAGYTNWRSLGENIYAYARDVVEGHAAFVIDWGFDDIDYTAGQLLPNFRTLGDGMQDELGHRVNMMNSTFTEVGISVLAEGNSATEVGPKVITQDFGTTFGAKPQFVGVVIDDLDKDGFYDIGEGQAGVTLSFTRAGGGATVTATSWTSGGFQLALDAGTYTITATGAALAAPIVTTATIGSVNVHLTLIEGSVTAAPFRQTAASGDFNGDGKDDILWRHTDGRLTDWLGQANGGFAGNDANALTTVATAWAVAGIGDFNGDGRDDILWRHSDGRIGDWLGRTNGGFLNNDGVGLVSVPNEWKVIGIGDFNGDGRDDILWRHSDGRVGDWFGQANGTFAVNGGLTAAANEWTVVGTGDFNGDGRDDILWRHADGRIGDWLGQASGGFTVNASFYAAPTDWKVVGTGDFNGDGRDDILWRNADGRIGDWLGQANGGFVTNPIAPVPAPTTWQVAGTGDYNGDGRDDILWRSADGQVGDWLGRVDGGFTVNSAGVMAVDPAWQVQVYGVFAM
jgi:uncharacterized protein YkwD